MINSVACSGTSILFFVYISEPEGLRLINPRRFLPSRFRYFADNVRDDYAAGQLDAQVEGVLQEMRELSICGGSS